LFALRTELAPVPSLIVTGRQSLDEFKRLEHAGVMFRCGKKHAVRMLDDVVHDGYPGAEK
jgi:hypothetical protein